MSPTVEIMTDSLVLSVVVQPPGASGDGGTAKQQLWVQPGLALPARCPVLQKDCDSSGGKISCGKGVSRLINKGFRYRPRDERLKGRV